MKTKFTPGPWKAYNDHPITIEYGPGDRGGFELVNFRGHKDEWADARLIAAAPDMFALLSEAVAKQEAGTGDYKWLCRANEALAKARGEGK